MSAPGPLVLMLKGHPGDQRYFMLSGEPASWAESRNQDDDEDAACFRGGSPRLVLILRDTPEHLSPVADRLTALGYVPDCQSSRPS